MTGKPAKSVASCHSIPYLKGKPLGGQSHGNRRSGRIETTSILSASGVRRNYMAKAELPEPKL
ncbi:MULTISPECIES: hypothetical protein [Paenibacillus]|uniref:hypothetical protein n=1 Tax=Paenibacillus TaxID=44249 RepID=UPI0015C304FA|nr:hypothetical protein [Paenibacillus odorifer]